MDSNALTGLLGVGLGGAATIYNLVTLRRLGLSEAHHQLEALQQAALSLQKDETARWKASYEQAQQQATEQDRKITEQRELIEANCKEIEGLKMLIAQQAITQNFILREVVRRPDLRADLEKSWVRIEASLIGMRDEEWGTSHE
ncbi:MAG: hypothetical protein JO316_17300 [Abitibacteriaceae bacterium]|nr:hypothetical protein [Abditibacteriaceae bacterium]MBV9867114.1 hypothetical protein [Abditibacteriaceae bacterium]